ncbi:RICIN domain-containing protein [Streptosporangiaceae bacterium NEAU-GS5]|nr:RICIN domain-containing protein [Streptosporangiaceae bacterium NEAU-GS5]
MARDGPPGFGGAERGGTQFRIQRAGTSLCLQPQRDVNSQVINFTCSSTSAAQRWTALTTATAGMQLVNLGIGGPCLAVHNNLTIPGAPVEAEECSPDPNEFWYLISTDAPSTGTYVIQNPASHLCLTIFSGTFAGLDNCNLTSSSQRFTLVPALGATTRSHVKHH